MQGMTGLLGSPVSTMTCRGVTLGDGRARGRSGAWGTCTLLVCVLETFDEMFLVAPVSVE